MVTLPYKVNDIVKLGPGDVIVDNVYQKYFSENRGLSSDKSREVIKIGEVLKNVGKVDIKGIIKDIQGCMIFRAGYDIPDSIVIEWVDKVVPAIDMNDLFDTSVYCGEYLITYCENETYHGSEMGHSYTEAYIKTKAKKILGDGKVSENEIEISCKNSGNWPQVFGHALIEISNIFIFR